MAGTRNVLLIGLDPAVVDYSRWPGLTPEKIEASLRSAERTLNGDGYDSRICLVGRGEAALAAVKDLLAALEYDCVMIGAGVRTDAQEFALFETLINVVHAHAPTAKICFNTMPSDTVAAVKRWLP